jgi:hypothetical protein
VRADPLSNTTASPQHPANDGAQHCHCKDWFELQARQVASLQTMADLTQLLLAASQAGECSHPAFYRVRRRRTMDAEQESFVNASRKATIHLCSRIASYCRRFGLIQCAHPADPFCRVSHHRRFRRRTVHQRLRDS